MSKFRKKIQWINYYPPYVAAGIKMTECNDECTRFKVEMKLRWYNRNLVGTHFGGSLYSMCDPFYMFILMCNLGKDYIVWDKSAKIDFKKPGKGTVHAIFEIDPAEIQRIKEEIEVKGKSTYFYYPEVKDESGQVIATLEKEVYVRKKRPKS